MQHSWILNVTFISHFFSQSHYHKPKHPKIDLSIYYCIQHNLVITHLHFSIQKFWFSATELVKSKTKAITKKLNPKKLKLCFNSPLLKLSMRNKPKILVTLLKRSYHCLSWTEWKNLGHWSADGPLKCHVWCWCCPFIQNETVVLVCVHIGR